MIDKAVKSEVAEGAQKKRTPLRSAEAATKPPTHPSFGEKLRAYRERNDISLKELAEKAEISIGILSQMERGINSPSLRTLTKVRTALGLPSSFFFDDDHAPKDLNGEEKFVCRADERPQLHLGRGAVHKELLHHNPSRVFEFMTIELPPKSQTGTSSYPSEKGGMVLEGEVVVTIGDTSAVLYEGDSLLFDGITPHKLDNRTNRTAKLIWIIAKLPNELLV
jgi:transcriptional regulator with XRE-family HTH domain